jgi:GT2 family glycosyltransferase
MPVVADYSLIVPAHRGGPMLEACLDHIARLDPAPGEVIIAVDGADPAVLAAAARRSFTALACPTAPGVAATRNAGVRASRGAVLVFADSDTLLPTDHLARLTALWVRHPEAAAIIGSYDAAPAAPGLVSRYRNLLHHYTHQRGAEEAQTFWAACGAVRRDAFEAIGGFDEAYRIPSVEDIELGYRLRRAGHHIRLAADWQVKHLKRWRLRDLIVTDIGRRAIPWTRLLRREGRLDNDLNIDRSSRLNAALVCGGGALVVAGSVWGPGLPAGAILLAVAVVRNLPFYRFLGRTGGWPLAVGAVPLHWLYFAGAVVGFLLGLIRSNPR